MLNPTAEINLIDAFERIPVQIFPTLSEGSKAAAQEIAALIKEKQSQGETCVLGLATGSTPRTLYAELVKLHQEEGLSFQNVITFNLDEYYPIEKDAWQSYNNYMRYLTGCQFYFVDEQLDVSLVTYLKPGAVAA